MKNYKRASRRRSKKLNFKRRVDIWIQYSEYHNRLNLKEKILKGEEQTFLKTTSCPCNCYSCSGINKYKRTPKFKILGDIFKEL